MMEESNVKKPYSYDPVVVDPNTTTGFKEFLYNSKTGAVMGRTALSWAKITIFYIIFFINLAIFCRTYYYLFSLTLSMERPKYIMSDSLIGTNPGVGFRPMPDPDTSADSTLIWFKRGDNPNDYNFWSNQLEEFVDEIETGKSDVGSQYLQACTLENGNRANSMKACQVDTNKFKTCQKNNQFGYRIGEPCILIKINRIYGWTPEPYGIDENNRFSQSQLENDLYQETEMKEDLKSYILNVTRNYKDETVIRRVLETVWISCAGENNADRENVGPIEYYPMRGINGFYFPFLGQKGYQSPFIFIQLKRPMPGVLINIECKAFAKNVIPDRLLRLASTHFEVLID